MPIQKSVLFGTLALSSLCRPAWSDETTACVNLDNLAAYTNPVVAWSDQHSNVALAWPRQDEPGLQNLTSVVGWGGGTDHRPTPQLELERRSQAAAAKVEIAQLPPDKVVEIDAADGLELTVIAAWPGGNPLALEFTLSNQTAKPRTIELSFDYPGKGRKPDWKGPCPCRPVCLAGERTRGMLVDTVRPQRARPQFPVGKRLCGRDGATGRRWNLSA